MPLERGARLLGRMFSTEQGALVFIVRTSVITWLLTEAVASPISYISGWTDVDEFEGEAVVNIVLPLLVFAPLVENILLIGLIELLGVFNVSHRGVLVMTTAVSVLLHGLAGGWRFISGFAFATVAHAYHVYRNSTFSKRYFITVGQHALLNTPSTLALIYGW